MKNAKLVVNVLLVATIFSTAYYQALPSTTVSLVDFSAFLIGEGAAHSLPVVKQRTLGEMPLTEEYGPAYTVTATAYQAVEAQTDDEPFVTADNSFIKPGYSSKLRWLAISRDLLVHWGGRIKYGDQVQVRGVSTELDGLYTVHDTMNRRHRHCIDILSNPAEKLDIFTKGVKIRRVRTNTLAKTTQRPAPRPLLASAQKGRTLGVASRTPLQRFVQPSDPRVRLDYLVSAIL